MLSLKKWANEDNIFVDFGRQNGVMFYRVIKTMCYSFETALAHVRSLQAQLAPSEEVRS